MLKRILLVLLITFLALPIYFQAVQSTVNAQAAPLTSPTTPVTFFNLVGKVTYKQLGRLMNNAQRVMPAPGVMVKIVGFFNKNITYSATTDQNGNYQLQLPKGLYKVSVSDANDTFFVPPFRVENVRENRVQRADFQGLKFP